MSIRIQNIIPKQGFEIVGDAIGVILLEELTHQKSLQNFPEELIILSEALIPQDSVDELVINILLDSATYGQITQKDAQGRTLYFIDVYTVGQKSADGATSGSADSCKRRDKFLGMIMYIFRSAQYRTLGLQPGLIGGTYVESFATLDPYKKEDSDFTTFARIQLAVRIQEDTVAWAGVELLGENSMVNLDSTDKGYKYVFNS